MAFILIAAGALLRFSMLAFPRSFWEDEWASIEFSRGSAWDVVVMNAQDTHPPLYFLFLHALIKLVGFCEWAFRAPSLLAGVATLGAIYFAAKNLFDKKTALWALAFAAVSPYLLHLSFEIRHHGLPILFYALSAGCFSKMLTTNAAKKWGWAFVVCTAMAAYTVHFAWFWIGALLVWQLWNLKNFPGTKPALRWQALLWALNLPSLALLAFHVFFKEQYSPLGSTPLYTPLTILKEITIVFWNFICGPRFDLHQSVRILDFARHSPFFWVSGLLFLVFVYSAAKMARGLRLLFILAAVLPVLVVGVINPTRLDARYFGFAALLSLLALADWVATRPRLQQISVAGLYFFVALGSSLWMLPLNTDPMHRDDFKTMVREVFTQAGPEDVVFSTMSPLELYYLETQKIPKRATFIQDPSRLSAPMLNRFQKAWLLGGTATAYSDFPEIRERLRQLGFVPEGDEIRYGGDGSYLVVNVFRKA